MKNIIHDLKQHTLQFIYGDKTQLLATHSSKRLQTPEVQKKTVDGCRKILRFLEEHDVHVAVVPGSFAHMFYLDGDKVKQDGFTVGRHDKMSVDDFIDYLQTEMKTLKDNGISIWKIDAVNDKVWFRLHKKKAMTYDDISQDVKLETEKEYDPNKFNEDYYEEMSITDSFSLLRPLKKSLTETYSFLPPGCSITVFAFEYWKRLDQLKKSFSSIHGYDINEFAVQQAEKNGYEGKVKVQNVIDDFEPLFPKTDVSICFYLLEHLSDEQCQRVLRNMMKQSPMNFIVVTSNDHYNYYLDHTHINPKSNSEWNRFLVDYYTSHGWKKLNGKEGRLLFLRNDLHNSVASLQKRISTGITNIMTEIIESAQTNGN